MNDNTRTGLILGLCVLAAITALTLAHALTRDRIEDVRQEWLLQSLTDVLPDGPFDSDPLHSVRMVTAPELGNDAAHAIYTAYRHASPVGAVLSVVAPDGYNGDIHLLVGVDYDGQITGVRVSEHRETPGLGDRIDDSRSDWITHFDGQSLVSSAAGDWAVRKNGGRYDAFTGATITPRAVINAVHRALLWYADHRPELFAS